MNTDTGALRELGPDEQLARVEDLEAIDMAGGEVPPEVEVPASYLPLTPEQRLALAFGYRGGKDRKAANPRKKTDRQRRYERAAWRRARDERGADR